MKNALFLPIGSRNRASSRFRVYNPIDRLAGESCLIKNLSFYPYDLSLRPLNTLLSFLSRIFYYYPYIFFVGPKFSVIYVQETLLPVWMVKWLKYHDCKIVYDFSDPLDIYYAKHSNASIFSFHKQMLSRFNYICKQSDKIIIENRNYLTRLSQYSEKMIVQGGPVDERIFANSPRQKTESDPIIIGWTGSPATFKLLAPILGVIDEVCASFNAELWLIGCGTVDLSLKNLKYRIIPWSAVSEPSYLEMFDIGIFYLEANLASNLRGGGKLFLYLASFTAIIASDVGIASQLLTNHKNIGTLVSNTSTAWKTALEANLSDPNIRLRHCLNGRRVFDENYSLASSMNLYESLLDF